MSDKTSTDSSTDNKESCDGNQEGSSNSIKIKIKATTDTYEIEVKKDDTVKEVKNLTLPKLNNPSLTNIDRLCLIFSGKILKDHETLEQHALQSKTIIILGISDGLTLHLVIRTVPPSSTNQQPATANQTPPRQTNPTPSPFGLFANGPPGVNDLLSNPEMMRQAMSNPMVQSLMNNPEIFRTIIANNPQMQQIIERNPEIGHLLNNPDVMRQTMEMIRNPAAFQELMRSHDRAVSNLESIPGGMAALHRLYRDVQEPMLNAAHEQLGGSNPFASLANNANTDTSQSARAGVENTEPLPNPWAQRSATNTSTPSRTQSGTTPNLGSVLNTPSMESLMRQMTSDPQMTQSLLQGPHMQNMLQFLTSNPQLTEQLLANAGGSLSGGLQEQMRSMMPQMIQHMQNPEILRAMTNPRVLQAIMQIQQSMQVLQTEAPGLFTA
uniref:Ubiquitin-like domain-containing protein n=1 Tax=Romanomermis culicivorax TaxID=13658 RepID=A0A915IUP2_ROMCU